MIWKFASWNVNGLRAITNKNLFWPFVQSYKPDIIGLQEVKIHDLAITKLKFSDQGGPASGWDFPGYTEYWNPAERPGYSGTAIFSKKEAESITRGLPEAIHKKFDMTRDKYGDPSTEGRVTVAEYDKFYFVTVYTPNAKDDLSRIPLRHQLWDPAFLAYMKQLEKKKPVIFCGDLNVAHTPLDLARPKPNEGKKGFTQEEREGIDRVIEAGFVDTFRMFNKGNGHYTWWSHFGNARANNTGWRIDYFFVSGKLKSKVKKAQIHPEFLGSDHCPITLEVDI